MFKIFSRCGIHSLARCFWYASCSYKICEIRKQRQNGTTDERVGSDNKKYLSCCKNWKHWAVYPWGEAQNNVQARTQAALYMEQKTISFFAFTKDIAPFKCEDCTSAYWIWLRPYPTGNFSQVMNLNAFLYKNELGNELDYHIYSYQEVSVGLMTKFLLQLDAAFAMDLMGYTFEWLLHVNTSLNLIPKPHYSCDVFTRNEYNITLQDIVLQNNLHEYGNYIEQSAGQFFQVILFFQTFQPRWVQDVEARIFRIDRTIDYENEFYNKQLGYWRVTNKLTIFYGTLDVNVRLLDIYRIVTLIVSCG